MYWILFKFKFLLTTQTHKEIKLQKSRKVMLKTYGSVVALYHSLKLKISKELFSSGKEILSTFVKEAYIMKLFNMLILFP